MGSNPQRIAFNFNPPTRKGWDWTLTKSQRPRMGFQSTHPQGVGQQGQQLRGLLLQISIHPPARGGTVQIVLLWGIGLISIHPPARGGTVGTWTPGSPSSSFQSTHPQGVGPIKTKSLPMTYQNFNPPTRKGWDNQLMANSTVADISIHPPARGGTHPHEWLWAYHIFQSTHPQGVGP